MGRIWAWVRAVAAPVRRSGERFDQWWDRHELVTLLILPVFVPWSLVVYGFRWWTVPFGLLAAFALVRWVQVVAGRLRGTRRG